MPEQSWVPKSVRSGAQSFVGMFVGISVFCGGPCYTNVIPAPGTISQYQAVSSNLNPPSLCYGARVHARLMRSHVVSSHLNILLVDFDGMSSSPTS